MRRVLFIMVSVALLLFACASTETSSGNGSLPGDNGAVAVVDAGRTDASDAAAAVSDAGTDATADAGDGG